MRYGPPRRHTDTHTNLELVCNAYGARVCQVFYERGVRRAHHNRNADEEAHHTWSGNGSTHDHTLGLITADKDQLLFLQLYIDMQAWRGGRGGRHSPSAAETDTLGQALHWKPVAR